MADEQKGFLADALLVGLLNARTDAERQALMVAASRVSQGESSSACEDQRYHELNREEPCLLCGKIGREER